MRRGVAADDYAEIPGHAAALQQRLCEAGGFIGADTEFEAGITQGIEAIEHACVGRGMAAIQHGVMPPVGRQQGLKAGATVRRTQMAQAALHQHIDAFADEALDGGGSNITVAALGQRGAGGGGEIGRRVQQGAIEIEQHGAHRSAQRLHCQARCGGVIHAAPLGPPCLRPCPFCGN